MSPDARDWRDDCDIDPARTGRPPMTAEQAMARALDGARLTREAVMAQAKAEASALDELVAWREVDRQGYDTEEWWAATYRLRDITDRLIDDRDRDGIRATIRTAQAIIRGDQRQQVEGWACGCGAQGALYEDATEQERELFEATYELHAACDEPEPLPCGHRDEDRCDACTPDGPL